MILDTAFKLHGEHRGQYVAVGEEDRGIVRLGSIGVRRVWRRGSEIRSVSVFHPQIISAAKEHLEMQLLRKVSA